MQCAAVCCGACCSVLGKGVTVRSVLRHAANRNSPSNTTSRPFSITPSATPMARSLHMRHLAVHAALAVLQCVAVCCSVLQCVAVCCSVLQYVAVCRSVAVVCFAVCHPDSTILGWSQCVSVAPYFTRLYCAQCYPPIHLCLVLQVLVPAGGRTE